MTDPAANPFGKFPKPKIAAGDTLWLSDGQHQHSRQLNRYPVLVKHTFIGKDDRRHCVLEIEREGVASYKLVAAMALAPAQTGPDFLSLMLDSPQSAKSMLFDIGIIDGKGDLRQEYGGQASPDSPAAIIRKKASKAKPRIGV